MAFKVTALLSAFMLISHLAPLVFTSDNFMGSCSERPLATSHLTKIHQCQRNIDSYPVSLVVYNSLNPQPNLTFHTNIAQRGILLGAMKKIHAAEPENFMFTTTESIDYGPYLESVNGLGGNAKDQTYWQLVVELQSGTIIVPDIGVGCYIPNPHDTVVLKFTKWEFEEAQANYKS